MSCLRCGGLMVSDRFYDYRDDTGQNEFEGYRCLMCGEVLDQVILSHRKGAESSAVH